jgi:hypothetical protein
MVLFSRDPVNLIPGFGLLSESSFLLLLPFLPPSGLTFSIFSVHTCDCRPERGREREIDRERERERERESRHHKGVENQALCPIFCLSSYFSRFLLLSLPCFRDLFKPVLFALRIKVDTKEEEEVKERTARLILHVWRRSGQN